MENNKICNRCKESKPESKFYKINKKDKLGNHFVYITACCRICCKLPPLAKRVPVEKDINKDAVVCKKCKEPKPGSEYFTSKRVVDGEEVLVLRGSCKQCSTSRTIIRRREYEKEELEKDAVGFKRKVSSKRRQYMSKPECKARKRLHDKEYHKKNPHKSLESGARRRAKQRKACPSWADTKKIDLIYEKRASLQNKEGKDYHVDHMVPIKSDKVCGLHCEHNLQILSKTENLSKGNRWWPDMWENEKVEQ